MSSPAAKIQAIHRYPVKGLTPEPLPRTTLAVRQTCRVDRMYAIENGPSGFDPAAPGYLPKQRFLMLMRNARLAELRTAFDEASHTLTIRSENREAARGDLRTPEGRAAIERFFAEFCADELRGPPKVLHAAGPQLFRRGAEGGLDHQPRLGRGAGGCGRRAGPSAPLPRQSPCRRLAGLARVRSAQRGNRRSDRSARLKVVKRIVRCAATEVDPDTGIRDLPIPRTLMEHFGHADCGVYAEVIEGGPIAVGDAVT